MINFYRNESWWLSRSRVPFTCRRGKRGWRIDSTVPNARKRKVEEGFQEGWITQTFRIRSNAASRFRLTEFYSAAFKPDFYPWSLPVPRSVHSVTFNSAFYSTAFLNHPREVPFILFYFFFHFTFPRRYCFRTFNCESANRLQTWFFVNPRRSAGIPGSLLDRWWFGSHLSVLSS